MILAVDCDSAMLRLHAGNSGAEARCATLWRDSVDWPDPLPDIHIHLSPPCIMLSSARRGVSSERDMQLGVDDIRKSLDFVLDRKYVSWSLENVSQPGVRALLSNYAAKWPTRVAWTELDASDCGAPTNRVRLIAGPPRMIALLRELPVRRCSVADAFAARGMELPAQYIKNATRRRNGRACMRSVHGPAHCQTASHPLTWCTADGSTVRCLTVRETAVLQDFPDEWMLPRGSRDGIHALGNAVIPAVGEAIMKCAMKARQKSECRDGGG